MYRSLHCIALRTVRHSDSKNLLSAWSRELGRVTFSMPSGAGREARRRRGLTSPLALFEGEADVRPGREILQMRDLRPMAGSLAMDTSPVKGLTALFLAEFLDLIMRRAEPDGALSDFVFASLEYFAEMTDAGALANFHLVFVCRLMHYAGIAPDVTEDGSFFDMREGRFRTTPPLHAEWLDENETAMLRVLAGARYDTAATVAQERLSRNILLDIMLRYYSIHLMPLTSLKSLEVLRGL
ncbi:MAG: DNA repair protein RecO C-terminal domain-containing protein [Muribaculaceae bacterium]|nr:DNA repair protein RecO C-terminal domain-containing protein [Muribaculaceae bacterium]MDE6135711.1 DNA repair protein RecO C-terminal domain-containing protein [Muribaculaceae bacterium]